MIEEIERRENGKRRAKKKRAKARRDNEEDRTLSLSSFSLPLTGNAAGVVVSAATPGTVFATGVIYCGATKAVPAQMRGEYW